MTDPVQFSSRTPRHDFPTLVAGQAQKELYVNEALARIDTLLHPCAEGEADSPPTAPQIGETWIVGGNASGDWLGMEGSLAAWDGDQWTFCAPTAGTQVHVQSTGTRWVYDSGWQAPVRPAAPSGGATIDSEARTALLALIDALANVGIIPEN